MPAAPPTSPPCNTTPRSIAGFYLEYARRTFEAAGDGLDIFMMGDDFGTQNGLFMSPEMWRDYLMPNFKAMIGWVNR